VPETLARVREALILPWRAELIARNAQGLAELSSVLVTDEAAPSEKSTSIQLN
jgi:hypothetical protein